VSKRLSYLFALSLVLLWGAIDFNTRLAISNDSIKELSVDTNNNIVIVKILEQSKVKNLILSLARYDVEEVMDTKPRVKIVKTKQAVLMTIEEQNKQAGELNNLFDGENKFSLIATFNDSQKKFILLNKLNLVSGKEEQIRLFLGEKLAVYNLNSINHDYVVLSHGQRQIYLKLFIMKNNKV
jgi:hypothetical protein